MKIQPGPIEEGPKIQILDKLSKKGKEIKKSTDGPGTPFFVMSHVNNKPSIPSYAIF